MLNRRRERREDPPGPSRDSDSTDSDDYYKPRRETVDESVDLKRIILSSDTSSNEECEPDTPNKASDLSESDEEGQGDNGVNVLLKELERDLEYDSQNDFDSDYEDDEESAEESGEESDEDEEGPSSGLRRPPLQKAKKQHVQYVKTAVSETVEELMRGEFTKLQEATQFTSRVFLSFKKGVNKSHVYFLIGNLNNKCENIKDFLKRDAVYFGMGTFTRAYDHFIASNLFYSLPKDVRSELPANFDKEYAIYNGFNGEGDVFHIVRLEFVSREAAFYAERCLLEACGTVHLHNHQGGTRTECDPQYDQLKRHQIGACLLNLAFKVYENRGAKEKYNDLLGVKTGSYEKLKWSEELLQKQPVFLPSWAQVLVKGIIGGKYRINDKELFTRFLVAYTGPKLRWLQDTKGMSREQASAYLDELKSKYSKESVCQYGECETMCRAVFCWEHSEEKKSAWGKCKKCGAASKHLRAGRRCLRCMEPRKCAQDDCQNLWYMGHRLCRQHMEMKLCVNHESEGCPNTVHKSLSRCYECYINQKCVSESCKNRRYAGHDKCRECFDSVNTCANGCNAKRANRSNLCWPCLQKVVCSNHGSTGCNNLRYNKFALCRTCYDEEYTCDNFEESDQCEGIRYLTSRFCKTCYHEMNLCDTEGCEAERFTTQRFCKSCFRNQVCSNNAKNGCTNKRHGGGAFCFGCKPKRPCKNCGKQLSGGRNFCAKTKTRHCAGEWEKKQERNQQTESGEESE